MRKFSLLSINNLFGSKISKIFKIRGRSADTTDYGIVTGTQVITDKKKYGKMRIGKYWYDGHQEERLDDRDWWSTYSYFCMQAIRVNGYRYEPIFSQDCGIRMAMTYSSIDDLQKNKDSSVKKANDGILEIEYGYYPQKIVDRKMQENLEELYHSRKLSRTGNTYTTHISGTYVGGIEKDGIPHDEYKYNGKRYVRLNLKKINSNTHYVRKNNHNFYENLWFEVQPVKWLVDEDSKLMVTDKIILGGVIYNKNEIEETPEGYEKTSVRKFINKYLQKELLACELEPIRLEELRGENTQEKHTKEEVQNSISAGIKGFRKIGQAYKSFVERNNNMQESEFSK